MSCQLASCCKIQIKMIYFTLFLPSLSISWGLYSKTVIFNPDISCVIPDLLAVPSHRKDLKFCSQLSALIFSIWENWTSVSSACRNPNGSSSGLYWRVHSVDCRSWGKECVFSLCGSLLEHQQHFVKCVFLCRLSGCGVTEEGCSSLASAVTSNPSSQLKQLDLNFSHLGDSALKKLSAALETVKWVDDRIYRIHLIQN